MQNELSKFDFNYKNITLACIKVKAHGDADTILMHFMHPVPHECALIGINTNEQKYGTRIRYRTMYYTRSAPESSIFQPPRTALTSLKSLIVITLIHIHVDNAGFAIEAKA